MLEISVQVYLIKTLLTIPQVHNVAFPDLSPIPLCFKHCPGSASLWFGTFISSHSSTTRSTLNLSLIFHWKKNVLLWFDQFMTILFLQCNKLKVLTRQLTSCFTILHITCEEFCLLVTIECPISLSRKMLHYTYNAYSYAGSWLCRFLWTWIRSSYILRQRFYNSCTKYCCIVSVRE